MLFAQKPRDQWRGLQDLASWLNGRWLEGTPMHEELDPEARREVEDAIRLLRVKTLKRSEREWLLRLFGRLHLVFEIHHRGALEGIQGNRLVQYGTFRKGGPPVGTYVDSFPMGRSEPNHDAGVFLLSHVSEGHLLDGLRKCKHKACDKWFVTRRRNKHYCSRDCQEEFWAERRKTPGGRKKEAKRLREWRQNQRDQKSQQGGN